MREEYVEKGLAKRVRTGADQGQFDLELSQSSLEELEALEEALDQRLTLDVHDRRGVGGEVIFQPVNPDRDADDEWKLTQVRKWLAQPQFRDQR